jgi:hypothetical protein
MANLLVKDGTGTNKYIKYHEGTDGSVSNPFVSETHAYLHGELGYHVNVGVFGELQTGEYHEEISCQFQYNISPFDAVTQVTGDGAVVQENSYAKLSSTTGTSVAYSRNTLRYQPAHTALATFTASFSGAGIGQAGLFDASNGVFLTYNNGAISVSYRNAGVDTTVASASFNGSISGVDFTKINVFRITYGWLGVAPIAISVMLPDGEFQLIHKFNTAGVLTNTHIGNPVLPIRISTSGAMTIKSGSWSAGNLGNGAKVGARSFSFPIDTNLSGASKTLSGTTLATLVNFRNVDTFNSKSNKVKTSLLRFSFHVDTPNSNVVGVVACQFIANPVLSGTPTWNSVYLNQSVMEYDNIATYGSGGQVVLTEYVGYAGGNKGASIGSFGFDAEQLGLVAYPSDLFSIVAKDSAGNNVTVRTTLNWEELF